MAATSGRAAYLTSRRLAQPRATGPLLPGGRAGLSRAQAAPATGGWKRAEFTDDIGKDHTIKQNTRRGILKGRSSSIRRRSG
jgi:hypothetical protein